MNALQKIEKARTSLILDHPFFGSLVLKFKLEEDNIFPTIWINENIIGYNTKFIEGLNPLELKGIIAHEIMHIALFHHLRRKNRDQKIWNKAGDYVINLILLNSGFTLLPDRLVDKKYNNMSIEEVYPLIVKEEDNKNKKQQNNQENNKQEEKNNSCGEVRDFSKKNSESEIIQEEQELKISIKQALSQAVSMGNIPGELKRLIKKEIKPKINWKEILKHFIEKTAKNDYTWNIPNRRFIHQNIYLPSLKSEQLKPICLCIDTSSSINKKLLGIFASELSYILEEYKFEINVIFCDTKINKIEHISCYDLPLKLEVNGRGGTNFKPPFKWVGDNNIDISCLIYFTDLECSSFPEEPYYPVLWAKQGKHGNKPPFGNIIQIENR